MIPEVFLASIEGLTHPAAPGSRLWHPQKRCLVWIGCLARESHEGHVATLSLHVSRLRATHKTKKKMILPCGVSEQGTGAPSWSQQHPTVFTRDSVSLIPAKVRRSCFGGLPSVFYVSLGTTTSPEILLSSLLLVEAEDLVLWSFKLNGKILDLKRKVFQKTPSSQKNLLTSRPFSPAKRQTRQNRNPQRTSLPRRSKSSQTIHIGFKC